MQHGLGDGSAGEGRREHEDAKNMKRQKNTAPEKNKKMRKKKRVCW
jgi:hypothetical protein